MISVIHFSVFAFWGELSCCFLIQGMNRGLKNKVSAVGTAMLNLAEYASAAEQKELELRLPLLLPAGAAEPQPVLCVCVLKSFTSPILILQALAFDIFLVVVVLEFYLFVIMSQ